MTAWSPDQPAFFAGVWVPQWTSLRKLKDGQTTYDLFAFLTTEPNAVVALIASLPLISILGILWLWRDTGDVNRVADHAQATL